MKDHLISKISQHIDLNSKEVELIRNSFQHKKFKANEYLDRADETSVNFYFIVEGLVRVFHIEEGKEINTIIVADNSFVSSYLSFIQQRPSIEYIQALEPTTTLSVSFHDMQNLYKTINNWDKVGRIIAEHNFIRMANRVLFLQMKSGRKKYLDFLNNSDPKVIQRTPSLHIASFLGMAPESLSRIKKGLLNS